jgi:hypothetical protein
LGAGTQLVSAIVCARPRTLGLAGVGKLDPSELGSKRRQPGAAILHASQQRRLVEPLLDQVRQGRQRRERRRLHDSPDSR